MKLAVNGIRLNVETWETSPPGPLSVDGEGGVGRGEGGGTLMALHGFTGRGTNWRPLAERLKGFRIIAPDIIGHGGSDAPAGAARYGMQACVDDLAAVLDALGIEKTALLGYSMGGRTALHFALAHPGRLTALVLESAAPGYADRGERAARIESDEDLAESVERNGIEWFADYWQALPLWDSQKQLPAEKRNALRQQRLQNSSSGLANSLRGMGAGAQEPVLDRLHEIDLPTLFMAGALDQRYVDLAREMAAHVAASEVRIIAGAGHAVHVEQPDGHALAVSEFLAKCLRANTLEGVR